MSPRSANDSKSRKNNTQKQQIRVKQRRIDWNAIICNVAKHILHCFIEKHPSTYQIIGSDALAVDSSSRIVRVKSQPQKQSSQTALAQTMSPELSGVGSLKRCTVWSLRLGMQSQSEGKQTVRNNAKRMCIFNLVKRVFSFNNMQSARKRTLCRIFRNVF